MSILTPKMYFSLQNVLPSNVNNFFRSIIFATLATLAIIAFCESIDAATFVVNTTSDSQDVTPGNGVCADGSGMCSLRAAITEANALAGADIITLPAGTYTESLVAVNENANVGGDFDITSPITINGEGSATTIVQANATPNVANERVFHILSLGTAVTISGLTIQNGVFRFAGSTSTSPLGGGGARVEGANANLTINDCLITNNLSERRGGGIATNKANLTINNCMFTNNRAGSSVASSDSYGGAVAIDSEDGLRVIGQTATITNTVISNNKAESSVTNTFGGGVAVRANSASVLIDACSINSNLSNSTNASFIGYAGGLDNQDAIVTIVNSIVSGNTSRRHPGVRNQSRPGSSSVASLNIVNSTISNNISTALDAQGGGIANISSSSYAFVTLNSSTVSGNSLSGALSGSTSVGGGIFNMSNSSGEARLTISNSTISGNNAHDTGGVYSDGPHAICVINFSTVAGNSALTNNGGGGVFQGGTVGGFTTISNSIVADNIATVSADVNSLVSSNDYNHIENPDTGFFPAMHDVTGSDPALGTLGNNGGPTQTHMPSAGSAVLDTIPNGTGNCGSSITTDQRRFIRPFGAGCDKGSVEFGGVEATPTLTSTATSTNTPTNTPTASPTPMNPFPTVATLLPTFVGFSTQMNGSANPNGSATTGWFRYSQTNPGVCNDSFGTRSPSSGGLDLGAGTSPQDYWLRFSEGFGGVTYYYCAIAQNASGVGFGTIISAQTPTSPIAVTSPATTITSNSATLNGSVNPRNNSAFGHFRISTVNPGTCNDSFGTRVPSSSASDASLGGGANAVSYSFNVTGLLAGTTQYYCAIGNNSIGNSFGTVLSFVTASPTPTSTNTPTDTPTSTPTITNTPTPTPTPSGNYPDTTMSLSTNTTVMPDAPPTNASSINVSVSTNFKGTLEGDPTNGAVRVTNAHPAGVYTVTLNMSGSSGTTIRTFMLTVTTPAVCNPLSFTQASHFGNTFVNGGYWSAVGDFNSDGKQDLAVSNFYGATVSILIGDGAGNFPTGSNFSVGSSSFSLAVTDFNGDGKEDVVTANRNTNNVSILLGDGAGNFSPATNFAAGTNPFYVAAGDFNNDGSPDIVAANNGSNNVSILIGDGNGAFSAPTNLSTNTQPRSVTVGDFNSDGKQDIAVAHNTFPNSVSILMGNGLGGFSPATNIDGGFTPRSITVGDFNDDGKQDLVVTNPSSHGLSILLGDGTGNFSGSSFFQSGPSARPISVGVIDFNGDTKQDLVVSDTNGILFMLGDGTGQFSWVNEIGDGSALTTISAVVGDFNGDGKQEVAAANLDSFDISVWMRGCGVSGAITYGNAIGEPTPRFIPSVILNATGSPPSNTQSAVNTGTYSLSIVGTGPYTVTPSKTGGVNGITSFDAAKIAQHVAGISSLIGNQLIVADTSGNNNVSSFDAGLIARYVAGAGPPYGNTGTWKFDPVTRMYPSMTASITGQDYVGLLMGEVSGNWNNTLPRPVDSIAAVPLYLRNRSAKAWVSAGLERGIAVELPNLVSAVEKEIVMPVNVQGVADKDVMSYEFDLRYDPSVIQPLDDGVEVKDTASRGLSVVTNATELGILRVVVYGAYPIDQDGVLLNLRFTAVGNSGSVSPLSFERIMFNEGEPRVNVAGGQIQVF